MKTLPLLGRVSAVTVLSLSLAACGLFSSPGPGPQPQPQPQPDARNWQDEVIYFAMTDRFANGNPANDSGPARGPGDVADKTNPLAWHGGDFAGLKSKIEEGYFKRMGFTALWITPVVLQVPAIAGPKDGPNAGRQFAGYHGYWAEDFFKTDPHLGSLEEYKALIDTAHKNGLKVIQDVVINHAGYGATLTKTNPDWFHSDAECQASSNKTTDCPLAGLPDFKQELPEVTAYLNSFIEYWRKNTAIDGLRIDTMKHVPDAYWKQFFAAGGAGDPGEIWSVGEVFDGNPAYLAHFMDDLGSPSVFDFALYFAVSQQMSGAGGNLDRVADVFAQDGVYKDASRLTTFVDNHDVKRFVSEVTGRGGTPVQAAERLDMALSTLYFSRGTPSVWQGTEYAQPGQGDPYNYPLGQGNREDMDFGKLAGSALDERLGALATARANYRALTHGAQQELWRPNGGPNVLAYRRVISDVAGAAGQPVVFVVNGGDTPVDLSTLGGGGIPLLGTFGGGALTEITGHASDLRMDGGKLIGTIPPRRTLAVTGAAGTGAGGTVVNPALPEVAALSARPGDSAVELTWTPSAASAVTGYRIYAKTGGGTERLLNFAPLPRDTGRYLARGVTNDAVTTFRVVTVDASGGESSGATVSATPGSKNTVKVTFTVDARSQGNGPIELRRFDTGSQLELPMTQVGRGLWKTEVELPLFREIEFKFGNRGPGAKNSGYEGPDQGNRRYVVGTAGNSYSGTYDFIEVPVPPAIEGRVTGAGGPLSGALVEATSANPKLNYALTFADGSYTLFAPAGAQTLKASAAGFRDATRQATSPQTGADFELAKEVTNARYTIDGDLGDWKAPKVSVQSPEKGVFDADNNFTSLLADSDATYLYLAYTYTVKGNSAIVYLDTGAGGALKADNFEAWKRAATFGGGMGGVDAFVARYEHQAAQLRRVSSDTATPEVNTADYRYAASGTLPAQTVELAIPWTALGLTGAPAGGVNIVGGIFGGDGYGAGDIIPDALSTPSGANTIGTEAEQRRATFTAPVNVK